jgi:hypothetical protein
LAPEIAGSYAFRYCENRRMAIPRHEFIASKSSPLVGG